MTVDEMRDKMREACADLACGDCPLTEAKDRDRFCYIGGSDEIVADHYRIMFPTTTDTSFDQSVNAQIERCRAVLLKKEKEYAADNDRLHNFRTAAALQGTTLLAALAGMMAKHTISIYDMCLSGKEYSRDIWYEKITDNANYLLLLTAAIDEIKAQDKNA